MIVRELLAIADVQPGMRLAVAVSDDAGRLLVPAATELTEAALESLRRRGIFQLQIEREVTVDPAVLASQRVEIEEQLARLFRNAGEGAETRTLYQAVLAFRLERCA